MPIYEFCCNGCHRNLSIFVRSVSASLSPVCPSCGSSNVGRCVSRFAYHKSMQTIHEESGEPQMFPGPDYYGDPRNIGRWTEKKFQGMGMEMPSQVRDMIDAARDGEMPGPLKDL